MKLVFFSIVLWVISVQVSAVEKSVLQVTSFKQPPNFEAPWLRKKVRTANHLGVLVGPETVLVSASAVTYQALIEANFVGESDTIPMIVAKVDYNVNLAILKPKVKGTLSEVKAVELGDDLALGESATLISGRKGQGYLSIPIRMREVYIQKVLTSSYAIAHYKFDVSQSSGLGWSEPIFKDGELVAISVGQDNDYVYGIPAKTIIKFLRDATSKNYRGFTSIGVSVRSLKSPYIRSFLKVPDDVKSGVLISDVFESSPFYNELKPFDVLIKVDGKLVNNTGYYDHPIWGKIHFIDLISGYSSGDTIKLTVIRNGLEMEVKAQGIVFDRLSRMIPDGRYSVDIPHLIFGGFIFQELDLGYLSMWGSRWRQDAPDEMVFLSQFKNFPHKSVDNKVVVLNRVLPHPHNKGYEWMNQIVLNKVNGYEVKSLGQLKDALTKRNTDHLDLALFEFSKGGGEAIISYKKIDGVHDTLAKEFNIPRRGSFF